MTDDNPEDMPLPLEAIGFDDVEAFGDDGPDPTTPLGAATLWWLALEDPVANANALANLSTNPAAWGDFQEARDLIWERSIMSIPEPCPGDPNIMYVKFIEYGGDQAAKAFAKAPLYDIMFLTVVKPEGSDWWMVWGLSHNHMPPPSQVYGTG